MKACREILAATRRADSLFNLIEEGDRIAVGVSGGKDSLCLVRVLSLYQKFCDRHFEIVPITLDMGFPSFDPTSIKEYVREQGYELEVVDAREVYKILLMNTKDEKHLPCSICSRMRKAIMNKAAKERGCNKVAFAHHMDDAIETKLMNEICGAREATFSPKMHLERSDIVFIRPFILVREKQIKRMVSEEDIPVVPIFCPADKHTNREDIKNLLSDIYKKYPRAYQNFETAIMNYPPFDLYYDKFEFQLGSKYTISPVNSVSQLFDYISFLPKEIDPRDINRAAQQQLIKERGEVVGVYDLTRLEKEVIVSSLTLKEGKEEIKEELIPYLEKFYFPKKITLKTE
ncbi:MAG: tRNA 2-thiocytidine biosynthesis TtcA family protein [Coprobacillus sp.]|nr:tRNA 2-thiocytidine biosynthesis TtcA family protein [Coprobacillus sp.]